MKKKIFLFLLTFIFCIIPTRVLADVARIGSTTYPTLAEAITAATDPNTTIVLLENLSVTVNVPNDRNIILDLDGHTLSNPTNKATVIENRGKLKITNGKVTSGASSGMINVYSGATLTITDGEYTATDSRQVIYNNGGTVTIGGTAELTSNTSVRATVHNLNNGVINITGGTIIANNSYAVYNDKGTLNIGVKDEEYNQGSPIIQGKTYGVIANDGINVYDGTIKGKTSQLGTANSATAPTVNDDPDETKVIDIEEYSVKSDYTDTSSGYKVLTYTLDNSNRPKVIFDVNGGIGESTSRRVFIGDSLGYLPEDPVKVDNLFAGWFTDPTGGDQIDENTKPTADTTYYAHWTYVDPNTVAYVEGVGNKSLQDAVALGGNITLLSDVVLTSPLVMSAAANLDLNGHTITLVNTAIRIKDEVTIDDSSSGKTGKITSNFDFTVLVGYSDTASNAKLTHKGGTIEGLGAYGAIRNYETTIIDGGTVQGTATESGYVIYNENELIMESGTVFSSNGRAIQVYENSTFTMNGGLVKSDAVSDQVVNLYGNCSATINGGTIEGLNAHMAGIAMFENTTLEVNGGTIKGTDMGIAGNGNEHSENANITINGGYIIATDGVGMYLPQRNSTTTINGGTITGPTGIELRASDLIVNDGTIIGTADTYEISTNLNGTTSKGAAVAISQHNSKQPINVTINGGNFTAAVPIGEGNPLGNPQSAIDQITIEILNGNFESLGDRVIDAEDPITINQQVSGGIYTYDPSAYIQDGYGVVKIADNKYEVTRVHNVTIDPDYTEIAETDSDKYPHKSLVEVRVKNKPGYDPVLIVKDTNGNLISSNGTKFIMPDDDVTIKVTYAVSVNPKTGDNIILDIVLLITSSIGLIITRILYSKKRLIKNG